jgi:hypothetical protein
MVYATDGFASSPEIVSLKKHQRKGLEKLKLTSSRTPENLFDVSDREEVANQGRHGF